MNEDPWAKYQDAPVTTEATAPETAAPIADPWAKYAPAGAPPPQSTATVAAPPSQAPPPDKYRQAAIEDRQKFIDAGITPSGSGHMAVPRLLGQGGGLGWTDELLAAGETPIQMFRRGTWDPREGYRYAKAAQDLNLEAARKDAGNLATPAEIAGGAMAVPGAAAVAAGRAVLGTGGRLLNYGRNIGTAGAFGLVSGAGEAPAIEAIPEHAGMGAILGIGAGAAAPAVFGTLGWAGGRVSNLLRANRLFDPENYATEQIYRAAQRAKVQPEAMVQAVTDANAAGQPMVPADVLGKSGERLLTQQAKAPGEQADLISEVLKQRAADRAMRRTDIVQQGLDVQGTAKQAADRLTKKAQTEAEPYYTASEAVPITATPEMLDILRAPGARGALQAGQEAEQNRLAGTGVPFTYWRPPESWGLPGPWPAPPPMSVLPPVAPGGVPVIVGGLPAAGEAPAMSILNRAKIGLDRKIEGQIDTTSGRMTPEGRDIVRLKNRLLEQIDAQNPAYAEARRIYGGPIRQRELIETGREMARGGRYEDTIPFYNALHPNEQAAQRIGYAEAIIDPMQKSRFGTPPAVLGKGSVKGTKELEAMSQYQGPLRPGEPDQLRARLNREELMADVERKALGGSPTYELAANAAEQGPSLGAMGQALSAAAHSNPIGVIQGGINMLSAIPGGPGQAQRNALTRVLLERDPVQLQELSNRMIAHRAMLDARARARAAALGNLSGTQISP